MVMQSYNDDFLGKLRVRVGVRGDGGWRAPRALQDRQSEVALCCVILPPAHAQVKQKQAQVRLAAQAEF